MKILLVGRDSDDISFIAECWGAVPQHNGVELVKTAPLDQGRDAEIRRQSEDCSAMVMVTTFSQLGEVESAFLREVKCHALLLVVYSPAGGRMTADKRQTILKTIRAQVKSIGLENVPVEGVFRPEGESSAKGAKSHADLLEKPQAICERIQVFAKAVSNIDRVPEAVLCPDAGQYETYNGYRLRLERKKKEFTWLSNILDIAVMVKVWQAGDSWGYGIIKAESARLAFPLAEIRQQLEGLDANGWRNAAGKLVPERMQADLGLRLEKWMNSKRIGSVCSLDLTLQCPDHRTTLEIQQSPIHVEVEK